MAVRLTFDFLVTLELRVDMISYTPWPGYGTVSRGRCWQKQSRLARDEVRRGLHYPRLQIATFAGVTNWTQLQRAGIG